VNQAFVGRYLAGRNTPGALIARGGGADVVMPTSRIVGVVADMSYRGLRDNSEQVFFPLFEHDDTGATFYIKVRGAPEQAIPSIRRIVRQADPRLPILWFRTLGDQVNRSLTTERLLAALSGSFGALALLLSLIGLYGVMSFVVTRRTREIGIRLALGATGASAIRLVLRDIVAMIAVGIAIALPGPRRRRSRGSIHPRMAGLEREPRGRPPAGIALIAASRWIRESVTFRSQC
jgi:hypothetical protein